jgi:hypothetical protein
MKNFIDYINAITQKPIIPKKAKMTTTIIMPELDSTEGIYRSILPSYIINSIEPDLRMLLVGISAKMNISNNLKEYHIEPSLIAETDHFVFPFVSHSLRPIVEEIKKQKPSCKFSYYVDANFYLMPDSYPFAKEYNLAKMINTIEDNFKVVDNVICTNDTLVDYIVKKLKERHEGVKFGTLFHFQRIFILPEIMKAEYTNPIEKDKLKVLLIADDTQFSDINFIRGTLKDFKSKYKNQVEIHIIGFNGIRNKQNYLKELDFIHHEKVPFFKYFELINHINPSVLLIPANKTEFNNTSKNYTKYLELAYANCPVIAPNIKPYSKLITTNVNGFLCDDKSSYMFQLETMFTEPAKYEGTLGLAYATALEYNISDPNNIEKLKRIYFPGYDK